ncbi:FG-GAP repeat domain-containing protein [Streptomyces sp. NPDC053367]|uniref:FG-GAP repeat domain-containing protein n=1 Tax=Streptomyces sp. NPDC053367 TaxID=3365700 RepID=UPI0037D1F172
MRRTYRLAALSAVLTLGLSTLLPAASAAGEEAPQERVVPATLRDTNLGAQLYYADAYMGMNGAGPEGVFHQMEGAGGLLWTRYADGRSFETPVKDGATVSATGSDVLAYRYSDRRVDLWNAADGTTRTFRMPEGRGWAGAYGNTVVGTSGVTGPDGTVTRVYHLLDVAEDGTVTDTEVGGLPEGMKLRVPRGADASDVMFDATLDGTPRVVAIDRATGRVKGWSGPLPSTAYAEVELSPEYVLVFSDTEDTKLLVLPRNDLSATPVEVDLAGLSPRNWVNDLAVVGDWLVHDFTGQITAKPIAGGDAVPLMAQGRMDMSSVSNGTAVAIGRTGADDWGIQRIHEGPDGRPVVSQVKALPEPPAEIRGLSLDQGRLVVRDDSERLRCSAFGRTVAVTGTPEFGERSEFVRGTSSCPAQDVRLFGTADGRVAWLESDGSNNLLRVDGPADRDPWERSVPAGGAIADVSGQYVLHTTPTTTYVYRIGDPGNPVATHPAGAAALSGDMLWAAGPIPGNVTLFRLGTAGSGRIGLDVDCTPTELQALGRYLYWTCDGKAGVYDRTARKSVPVPTGEAKLGDGYVVTHDKQAGTLVLTAVAGGTPESRVIGELPDTGVSQRDVRWTVDEAGANAAYVDDREQVHLVPSGVPQQPLRPLGPARSASYVEPHEFDAVPDTLTTVLLSKPSSGWDLTVRNRATGKVYTDGMQGGPARGELSVGWHGDDPARTGDAFVPSGTYDWTLTVTPADGVGGPLTVVGSVRLLHGDAVRHDHVGSDGLPDGNADLLGVDSAGRLNFLRGTGRGTFSVKEPGGVWSASTVAVPFGDLNGDRCNDVLVRMNDGSLRGYRVKCGLAPSPSMTYRNLGTGWNAHNVLTSPGDLTGDKRADLLARRASTGDLYLYAAKSDGTLAPAKKVASGWGIYTKVVGAGDLTGDGVGDVLARDRAGNLWRYDGTGTGTLKGRVKVAANWGATYNAVVGVGDITGDGKNDLVARDTAGNLYRQAGTGRGTFAARVKIGTGWQGYKGLF